MPKPTGAVAKSGKNTRRSRSNRPDKGGKINMPTNPPQIHYQPWYNLIVAWAHTGSLDVTPSTLVDKIRTQLDPHKHGFIWKDDAASRPFRLQVRLHSVRSWNLSGRQLALAVDDYSVHNAKDQEQVCGLVDSGTTLHVPACGYKLPASLANLVLRNDNSDKDDTIVHIIAPGGNACMTYLDITWRFDGPVVLTSDFWFQSDMHKLIASSNKVKENTLSCAEDASEITGILRSRERSGYIDAVINGISKTAEVVSLGAAVQLSEEDRDLFRALNTTLSKLRLYDTPDHSLLDDAEEVHDLDT